MQSAKPNSWPHAAAVTMHSSTRRAVISHPYALAALRRAARLRLPLALIILRPVAMEHNLRASVRSAATPLRTLSHALGWSIGSRPCCSIRAPQSLPQSLSLLLLLT